VFLVIFDVVVGGGGEYRYVATFYLSNLAKSSHVPQIWDQPNQWHSRMVFTSLRDAIELERLMRVCPQWQRASTSAYALSQIHFNC
jgi:hypothetical protein